MSIIDCKTYMLALVLLWGGWWEATAQAGSIAYQEDSWFTRFGYEQGYPEGIVLDMLQDQSGLLWIATADGLFKYDGYEFVEYRVKTDTIASLRSNVIRSIAEVDQTLYLSSDGRAAWTELDLSTEVIQHRSRKEDWIPTNQINQFYKDKAGRLWMASDKGLLMKPPGRDTLFQYQTDQGLRSLEVEAVFGTADGLLWVQTRQGLDVFDPARSQFQPLSWPFLQQTNIRALFEDARGMLWVGTMDGLYQVDRSNEVIQRVGDTGTMQLSNQTVHAIQQGADGRLYVGTSNGLNALDLAKEENRIFRSDRQAQQYISEGRVTCLFTDRQGLLWIGTWGKELQYLDFRERPFQYLRTPLPKGNDINAIEGIGNNLWLGTEAGGVLRLDITTGAFRNWTTDNGLGSNQIYALETWKEKIWAGQGFEGYLSALDPLSEQLSVYTPKNSGIPDEEIWAMTTDREGHLWIAGERSLYEITDLQPDGSLLIGRQYTELYKAAGDTFDIRPRYLLIDQENKLWIGTASNGVVYLDPASGDFLLYRPDSEDPGSLPGPYVNSIYEDRLGRIWVGTSQGIGILDRASGRFSTITEEDGLPNNFVFTIFEDRSGYFWFSTNRGLVRYAPDGQEIRVFTDQEGLPTNEFNKSAGLFWQGKVYYGTTEGLALLNPEHIVPNTYVPPVVFTHFIYKNRKLNVPPAEVRAIGYRDKIRLGYLENILELKFAALNYLQSSRNRYRYQLKGFSNNWIDLGKKRSIIFSGLEPGLYTLTVQGSNNDGVWNEEGASLKIQITPPFWRTSLAYFFYILLILGSLVYGYRYSIQRKLAKAEVLRQQELVKTKTRFFTNIAHEFKNPLTMILSMAHELDGNEKARSTIIRHGSDIRRLINQVLDLRRLENDQLPVEMVQVDIADFSQQVVASFEPFARQQSVDLHFTATPAPIMMDMDREKWTAILYNLVSNAIKYNKKNGRVEIKLSRGKEQEQAILRVEVRDTGRGIPQEALPHIFERFYQVDNSARTVGGTGVGLALVKEFVKLLDGKIRVESKLDEGTCFYLELPIRRYGPVFSTQEEVPFGIGAIALAQKEEQAPLIENTLLIVEDNQEILNYLEERLSKYFTVITAYNGEKGIAMAMEQVPDVIISDVMMPKKDGIELLETLKTNETTSHIPIILLTAKAAVDDRIRGLEKGADRYLGKPFLLDELRAHIRSLLENRKKMQHYFQQQLQEEIGTTEPTDPFLARAQKAVLDNLGDEYFTVNQLCSALKISRTQLHQKLKATIGKPATHFMNEIRLREGRKLLLSTDMNVSEVAYSVGFKDPGYFTTCYKELYRETPSETRK